jgi:outer membrane lipoprotein SlyB
MAMLAWIMMGLAIWHFTIFLPDRFWGGIVGAFLGALFGAIIIGLADNGFSVPGQDDTHLAAALEAIPGAIAGIALVYFVGVRQGNEAT